MDLNGQFFFVKNNKPVGPFTLDELLEKGVSNKTYIWTKGMVNWEKIESIPVILEKLNNNKPPVFIEPKSEGNNITQKGKGINKIILFAFIGIIVLVLGFIGFHLTKGTGELIWPNGEKYVGEIIYGLPNGLGTQTWPDGKKYVGEFKDGKRNGQGTLTSKSGEKYVGEFKDGKRNGQGTLTSKSGEKYVGEFKDGKKAGQGTLTNISGDKYVGEFKDGLPNGQGTVIDSNGLKYEGEIINGEFNGQGTLTIPNVGKYVGEFKNGIQNGQGTFTDSNGDKYVGDFKDGKYVGKEKLDNDASIKNPNIGTNSTLNNSSISSFGNGLVRCEKCGKSFPKRQGFCKMAGGTSLSSPCAMSYADIELGFALYNDRPDILDYYRMALNQGTWVCSKYCSYKIGLCID